MRRQRLSQVTVGLLGLLVTLPLVSSCADAAPPRETATVSETTSPGDSPVVRATTLAAAGEGRDAVVGLYPDLESEYDPDRDDRWYDCSGLDGGVERDGAAPPERIQRLSNRWFYAEPAAPTEPLIDAVVAALVNNGWAIGVQTNNDDGRDVFLRRDGYTLSIGGASRVVEGIDTSLLVSVSSPCIEAPADLEDTD